MTDQPPTSDPVDGSLGTTSTRIAVAVVLIANFMCGLDQWVVNVAVDAIGAQLPGADLGAISWVINGYGIALGAFLIVGGRLADRYGATRVFLIGLAVFTAASALCAAAGNLALLIGFRVAQGVGGALLTSASLSLLVSITAPADRPHAIRSWAAVGAVAAATGPSIGGVLAALDWRWIFLMNVPIGVTAIILTLRVPRLSGQPGAPHPDLVGALALSAAVAALVGLLVELPTAGWTGTTAGIGAALVVATLLFAIRTARSANPLIQARLFRLPGFSMVSAATLVYSAGFGVMLLSNSLWLQDVWRFGPALTGLAMAPGPIMVPVTTALLRRYGGTVRPIVFAACGGALFALSMTWGIVFRTPHPDYAAVLLPQLLLGGTATGLTVGNLLAAGTEHVPLAASGAAGGILNTARQVGSCLGVAVVVVALGTQANAVVGFDLAWAFAAAAGLATSALALVVRHRDATANLAVTSGLDLAPEGDG